MEHHDPQKYLYDIVSGCEFLLEFTRDKTIEDYKTDRPFRSALERELQIIGEAMLQLDKSSPQKSAQIDEYRSIIGFRHILVHGYDSLDPATVWNIIETKLDVLLKQARELL
ncbi:DUF86 domain-containing protein [Planctomycetota bacterium]